MFCACSTSIPISSNNDNEIRLKYLYPNQTAEFDIIYGKGISQEGCLLDLGVEYGIIDKSGAWFSYNGDKFAQGREKAKDYISENAEFKKELEEKIRASFNDGNN